MTNLKNYQSQLWIWILAVIISIITQVRPEEIPPAEFAPHVTATCKSDAMNIKVDFTSPYSGTIHARDYRNSNCMALGNGSTSVSLSLNMQAKNGQPDYCGIHVSTVSPDRTEERSIQLAVRVHKTLELADDKFYVITCGKTGLARDENSHVALKFFDNDRRVRETVYGRQYTVKAEVTQPNGTYGIRVKNCFAFDKKNISIALIDDRGCSESTDIMSKFHPSSDGTSATAQLYSMFKFPEGSEVHIQCDIVQCPGKCSEEDTCSSSSVKGSRPLSNGEGMLLAATTVFVLDPADVPSISAVCEEGGVRPAWLLWLTIALGVLFLIMLLMNIFLCTAMSCSCARTEIIEKEPSIIEEYDPYRSWHGSQYGSRYSLHGRDGHNKGYTSGGSTIHSNRSDRY